MTERQEQEPKPRHLRIGIMGPIGAGKSTLAGSLGERWGVIPKEERHRENPYLKLFYQEPERWSFKSQRFFVIDSVKQASSYDPSRTEILDPATEMHLTYAMTQYKMGWMNIAEWKDYKIIYRALRTAKGIHSPDLFISVNAPTDVLKVRIEKRLEEDSSRQHERWILGHLDYLDVLRGTVEEMLQVMSSKAPVLRISADDFDFSVNGGDRESILGRIEGFIALELSKNPRGRRGERLIGPPFAPVASRGKDITPGLSAEARRAYRG